MSSRGSRGAARWRALLLALFCAFPAAGAFLSFLEVVRNNVGGVEGLEGANGVIVSPDGDFVYVTGGGDDSLVVFSRDASGDALSFIEAFRDGINGVFGLAEASSVAVSSDLRHVYATAELDDSLVVFSRDAFTGDLTFVDVKVNGIGGVFGLDGAASTAVSPDGYHVFVAGKIDDALAVFSRDGTNDDLTLVDLEENGIGGVVGLDGANSVAVHPDGDQIYVAGRFDNSLAVFSRDGTNDDLTFLEAHFDGVGGVDGLDRASSVAVSSDGRHVFVTARRDDALAVFERDPMTGSLSFLAVYRDGVDGVDGLNGAESVVLSPDGGLVFVAGSIDDGVAAFSRDAATGELVFVKALRDGVNGVDGLDGAIALAVSPDALHVYVAAQDENALTSFRNLQVIFFDDFESGTTNAWSVTFPPP